MTKGPRTGIVFCRNYSNNISESLNKTYYVDCYGESAFIIKKNIFKV